MKKINLLFILLSTMLLNACNNSSNDPKVTLSSFFDALSKQDFVSARKLATTESKSMLDLMETGSKMDNSNKTNEKYDKSKMDFGDAKIEGDKAVVPVKEIQSGETLNFTLKKENGSWKVAFDKMTMMEMGMEKAGEKGGNFKDSLNKVMNEINKMRIDSLKNGLGESLRKIDSVSKKLKEMENE